MNNDLKHTIYSHSDCLSEQQLFDYIDDKLSQKERHVIEKHLLDCELCADALEGLEITKDRTRISHIKGLINLRIAGTSKKEAVVVSFNYKMVFSIAAAIALLVVGVFFFNKINLKEASMSDLAELKEESPAPPPPPPSFEAEQNSTGASDESAPGTGISSSEISKSTPAKIMDSEVALAEEEQFNQTNKVNQNGNGVAPVESVGSASGVYDVTISNNKRDDAVESITLPKANAPEREKNAQLDDSKNLEQKTVVTTSNTFSTPTTTTTTTVVIPDQKQQPASTTDSRKSKNIEPVELAKKSEKVGKYRSEGKAKDKVVTKESADEDANYGGVSGYEPQSVSQDAEGLKSEVTIGAVIEKVVTDSISMQEKPLITEMMPEFPGGQDSLRKFLAKNFNYDKALYKANPPASNKIYVQFTVAEDGTVKNPKILKGINTVLDNEALRVVKMMPKWKPVVQNGKKVSTTMNLPIKLEFK